MFLTYPLAVLHSELLSFDFSGFWNCAAKGKRKGFWQVDLNPGQLDALVAIADHGSFDAAARQLHITPSAVSQRIRALEAAAGQVLISRGTPCRPTPHGEWLVRLGRQTRLLYAEASPGHHGGDPG